VWVICEILGVPDEDRDKFSYWSDTLLNMTKYDGDEIRAAQTEFYTYLAGHVAAKRADPGDDLLSELANDPETTMSDATLIATGQGLLVAGHETTANMIGKMMAMLLVDRSRWEALLADPKLVRSAVEEALRLDVNAGFGMIRYIDQEIAIAGVQITPGTTVVCSMAAANRDETAFERAGEMDLARTPNPHLAFGAGLHSCLGQSLARTELQVTLETLLRKLPTLELAVPEAELQKVEGLLVGGLVAVPVRW
jgi:cytochrome P450